jgi:hypothetical protein
MELKIPPPGRRIVIVGFLPDNNGHSCTLHPFGCGNIMALQHADGGLGMHLHICMIVPDELACFQSIPMALMVVELHLWLGNVQWVRMGTGLMESMFALFPCSHLTMKTGLHVVCTITIVGTLLLKLLNLLLTIVITNN